MKTKLINTFSFEFQEIIKDELSFKRLLSYEISSEFIDEYFDNIFPTLKEKSEIKAGYVYFAPEDVKLLQNTIRIDGQLFEVGQIIYKGIKELDSIFIIVCTIGNNIEKCIWKYFNDGYSLEGYILDKMASELVELSADFLCKLIEEELSYSGIGVSNRYSPGYCGWSLFEQQKLFSLLPEDFCEIKLTSSSLMIPIKSISGIIAAGSRVSKKEYDCEICNDNFCYKKRIK